MRSDQVDLDERLEAAGVVPFQLVTGEHLDGQLVLAGGRLEVGLQLNLAENAVRLNRVLLLGLRGDERLQQRVRGLRVQRQRVVQRDQLRTLLQVALLQALAVRVEVLLDRLQGDLQDGALARRQVTIELRGGGNFDACVLEKKQEEMR